jgi:hypothetical protein
MDRLDDTISAAKAASEKAGHDQAAPGQNEVVLVRIGELIGRASATTRSTDRLKVAGLAVAGLTVLAVAATLAYRKHRREKPMSRLEHLKAQLGLSDADFKDLKANLSKLNLAQLKELNKAAW